MCYLVRVADGEDVLSGRVRGLLTELAPRLSRHWVESAQELLTHDEPNEALIQIAWGIATDRVPVPVEVVQFIEGVVGDPLDLPVDLSGSEGPPVSRRSSP